VLVELVLMEEEDPQKQVLTVVILPVLHQLVAAVVEKVLQ
jgi:hypothetical protein